MKFNINFFYIGILILFIYILIDYIRGEKRNIFKSIIIYSFIIYISMLLQFTTGGIHILEYKQRKLPIMVRMIPFEHIWEYFCSCINGEVDWLFWEWVKADIYKLMMSFCLGMYLCVLFNINNYKKAIKYIILSMITIESYQLILSYFQLIRHHIFDVDNLILNSLGGIIGFYVCKKYIKQPLDKYIQNHNRIHLDMKKKISICLIICVFIVSHLFIHSTPERVIRAELFKEGYFVNAFRTDIYIHHVDSQYGQQYSCRNPIIGISFYSVKHGRFNLWYINNAGCGEG